MEWGHWKKLTNQRDFFDSLAKTLKIKNTSDWIKINSRKIIELGGSSLLNYHYGGSLRKALKAIYSEKDWDSLLLSRAPNNYWKNIQNRRKAFEIIGKNMKIDKLSDWCKVSNVQFRKFGGGGLLKDYGGSLYKALQNTYPHFEFEASKFIQTPKNYWESQSNRRKFFVKLAEKYKINKPEEWGKITYTIVADNGGAALLKIYYQDSLFIALQKLFTEIEWRREWFKNLPKYSKSHWNNLSNLRIFIEELSSNYSLHSLSDWKRVSLSLIRKNGGQALIAKYNKSLSDILNAAFPLLTGKQDSYFSSYTSVSQRILWNLLLQFFPSTMMFENYRHPDMISEKSEKSVELDIWIPSLKLAFEYHGKHHFVSTYNKDLNDQRQRDHHRRSLCHKLSISLIEIPFWWNNEEESLLSTILHKRPDLISHIQSSLLKDPYSHNRLILNINSLRIPDSQNS